MKQMLELLGLVFSTPSLAQLRGPGKRIANGTELFFVGCYCGGYVLCKEIASDWASAECMQGRVWGPSPLKLSLEYTKTRICAISAVFQNMVARVCTAFGNVIARAALHCSNVKLRCGRGHKT